MEPPQNEDSHHHLPCREQHPPSPPTCTNCGGPTCFPAEPPPSATPSYIPIRFPAMNLPTPPTNTKEAIIRTPIPQPQKVDPYDPPYDFTLPSKKIHSQDDVVRLHSSPVFLNFLGFVVSLSESTKSRKLSDPCHVSLNVETLVSILQTLIDYVDEIPPAPQSARYGNVSYRVWHERMSNDAEAFMMKFLPPAMESAVVELVPYFTDSFGNSSRIDYAPQSARYGNVSYHVWHERMSNDAEAFMMKFLLPAMKSAVVELVPYFTDSFSNSSRIDYGTGHETNFAAWLYCLARLGIVREEDFPALVTRVFVEYLKLMRKLQLTYNLEPAGSHGVWGLDDYHFLPFVFGSSQLIDHKYMKPKSIHNEDNLENFSNEYMYLSCIAFVKKVKKGLFAEHSPMLDDISGVPTWKKVNSGLLKMYKVEVLQKVPIMQHFLFGSIIKWV